MNWNIDYPNNTEIENQKRITLDKAFLKRMDRPSPKVVFFNCKTSAAVSLTVHFMLTLFCAGIRHEDKTGGLLALSVFPITYFCFFCLSIMSESQSDMIDLKRSLKYSFTYLVSLRMFYASIAAVGLNIVLLLMCFRQISGIWSIGAAGTTATLLLALISLTMYEKTASMKPAAAMTAVYIFFCLSLMRYETNLYHLLIEVIPLMAHIVTALVTLTLFAAYIGKVEKINAYGC